MKNVANNHLFQSVCDQNIAEKFKLDDFSIANVYNISCIVICMTYEFLYLDAGVFFFSIIPINSTATLREFVEARPIRLVDHHIASPLAKSDTLIVHS